MINDEETITMTGIVAEDEFLCFERIAKKPKTFVYSVVSKSSNCRIGEIKWYPAWRHYCYFPTIEEEIVYSDRCLLSISNFLTEINKLQKQKEEKSK